MSRTKVAYPKSRQPFSFQLRGRVWRMAVKQNLKDHAFVNFADGVLTVDKKTWEGDLFCLRATLWHEFSHIINELIFNGIPDEESICLNSSHLNEILAETNTAMCELAPQLPAWLLTGVESNDETKSAAQ